MDGTETPNAEPPTFEDVQDQHGNDILLARDVEAMTAEERARSRENIRRLVEELRSTARPIRQDADG